MVEKYLIVSEPGDDSDNTVLNSISFTEFIFSQINIHGKSVSQIDGISGECLTYEELLKRAKILAASLLRLGVLPSETIVVACENRLEYSVVVLASLFIGTVLAPINPAYSPEEIVHALSISKPRIIFCSASTCENITLSLPRLKGICHVVLFDGTQNHPVSIVKYDLLLQGNPIKKCRQSKDNEVAVILTSSGTTGLPKGVMLSYANLKGFCMLIGRRTLHPSDAISGLVPLYHGYGYGMLLTTLLVGVKIILLPKFEDKLFLSTIENYKINNLYLVPPLMTFLGKHPLVEKYDLSSVRNVVCGAAPLSREVAMQVKARLPAADIRQGYGMTETSVAITITPPGSNKPESVGKLIPGLQAKIIDVETGKPLPRGEQGEILVRGPSVMVGYCNNPEATKEMIDKEGWLHTGDIGYVDDQGFFYIVDRIKELIKFKGFQVAPAELESLLLGMSGVRDAAVVGQPDLVVGELPVAYVVLQPNASLTETIIINYINGKVSPQKRLRGVKFIEAIPRNPSGKILRRILRDAFNSKL